MRAPSSLLGLLLALTFVGCEAAPDQVAPDAAPDGAAAACPADLEPCGVADDGWNVWCEDGVVHRDDLTRYLYCAQGTTEPTCAVGGEGDPAVVATCAAGCADTSVHWLETAEDDAAFDPESLCAPGASR